MRSDSALQAVSARLTGNRAMPIAHRVYHAAMRKAMQTYQNSKRGGLSARNWLRLECAPGDWERETAQPPPPEDLSTVEECLTVYISSSSSLASHPGEVREATCGAHGRGGIFDSAEEAVGRMRMRQAIYYSKTTYSKATRKVDILMGSASEGARKGYLRRCGHLISFFQWRQVSIWIDSRVGIWGGGVMNFI